MFKGRSPWQLRHYHAVLNAYLHKSVVIKNQKQLNRFQANPFAYIGSDTAGNP